MFLWGIGEGLKYAGKKISESISNCIEFFKNTWNKFIGFLAELIDKILNYIADWLSSIIDKIISILSNLNNFIGSIKEKIYIVTDGIKSAIFTGSTVKKAEEKVVEVLKNSNLKLENVEEDIKNSVVRQLLEDEKAEMEVKIHVSEEEQRKILKTLAREPQIYGISAME